LFIFLPFQYLLANTITGDEKGDKNTAAKDERQCIAFIGKREFVSIQVIVRCYVLPARVVSGETTTIGNVEIFDFGLHKSQL